MTLGKGEGTRSQAALVRAAGTRPAAASLLTQRRAAGSLPRCPHPTASSTRALPRWRRLPFWALALMGGVLFAGVGVAVLDDYGVGADEFAERRTARATLAYISGAAPEIATKKSHERFYGMAFQLPVLLLEQALGLDDSRHILLLRHLLTHLVFVAGGVCCGGLVFRLYGRRLPALVALLLFLLHPRLYAHSFFNPKDIPFLVLVMVALALTHRACRKDTLGAFALCGLSVGLAINLRIFGWMLVPAVLALRAVDAFLAPPPPPPPAAPPHLSDQCGLRGRRGRDRVRHVTGVVGQSAPPAGRRDDACAAPGPHRAVPGAAGPVGSPTVGVPADLVWPHRPPADPAPGGDRDREALLAGPPPPPPAAA